MPLCKKCKKDIPDGAAFCPWCGMRQERQKSVRGRGNGTGTAFKRGKTWTAQVTIGTEYDAEKDRIIRKYKTKGGFKTKVEALNACPSLYTATKMQKAPTLTYYWNSFYGNEMEKLSDSKRTAYLIAWKKLSPVATMPIDAITVPMLRETVEKAAPTFYPARDMKTLLTHLYKLAAADGWGRLDIPRLIVLPKNEEKERTPFSDIEQAQLWRSYDQGNENAGLALVMIYTGMMPGELRGVKVSMIDLDARRISGAGLKTDVRRKEAIILPADICPVLEDMMREKTDKLLPYSEHEFYRRYYDGIEKAGCRKLQPYSCRHTTATRHTIDESTPPQVVMRLMRWSSTRMMDRYVHPSEEDAQRAADELKKRL